MSHFRNLSFQNAQILGPPCNLDLTRDHHSQHAPMINRLPGDPRNAACCMVNCPPCTQSTRKNQNIQKVLSFRLLRSACVLFLVKNTYPLGRKRRREGNTTLYKIQYDLICGLRFLAFLSAVLRFRSRFFCGFAVFGRFFAVLRFQQPV